MRAAIAQNRTGSLHIVAGSALSVRANIGARMELQDSRIQQVINCATCPAATV
jgi:hypothetical protein